MCEDTLQKSVLLYRVGPGIELSSLGFTASGSTHGAISTQDICLSWGNSVPEGVKAENCSIDTERSQALCSLGLPCHWVAGNWEMFNVKVVGVGGYGVALSRASQCRPHPLSPHVQKGGDRRAGGFS